jgi:hypothetical protein
MAAFIETENDACPSSFISLENCIVQFIKFNHVFITDDDADRCPATQTSLIARSSPIMMVGSENNRQYGMG